MGAAYYVRYVRFKKCIVIKVQYVLINMLFHNVFSDLKPHKMGIPIRRHVSGIRCFCVAQMLINSRNFGYLPLLAYNK